MCSKIYKSQHPKWAAKINVKNSITTNMLNLCMFTSSANFNCYYRRVQGSGRKVPPGIGSTAPAGPGLHG